MVHTIHLEYRDGGLSPAIAAARAPVASRIAVMLAAHPPAEVARVVMLDGTERRVLALPAAERACAA